MSRLSVVLLSAALASAGLVAAQGMQGQSGMGMKDMHDHMGMMKSMDANGDGKISKEEFMKFHEAMFDRMPKSKDGTVAMNDMPMGCPMMKGGSDISGKAMGQGGMSDHGMMGGSPKKSQ